MTRFTKIAVTVPTEIYAVVERLRRQLGKSRSAVVASALADWVRGADRAEADRRYVEGYERIPEAAEAVDQIAAVAAQATAHWDAWPADTEAPSRWTTWPSEVKPLIVAEPSRPGPAPRGPRAGTRGRRARSSTPKRPRR